MEYQARFNRVEAKQATFEDGDKIYVLMQAGIPCAITDRGSFETLYAPLDQVEPVEEVAAKRPSKIPKKRAFVKIEPSNVTARSAGSMNARDWCLQVVKKKPLTSGEVFEAAKAAGYEGLIGGIYQALAKLKESGELESRNEPEEEGGLRKWFVVPK